MSKKRESLLSPLIFGTSLVSRTVVACLLGSLLVALPSTVNVANAASPTVTPLTIPSGLDRGVNDISVSDDGTKLVIVTGALNGSPYGGGVYQSLDSGATWTSTSSLPTDRNSVPSFVASNNTGQNVLIAPYSSSVLYLSANYGATWTAKSLVSMRAQCGGNNLAFVNTSPSGEASGMDMSGDGTIIAASKPFSSCMLISRDSGANFSYITLPVSMGAVGAVYVSSSGNAIWYAKSETGGGLWKYNLSTNSWGSNLSSTVGLPRSITGSQDGKIIYAAGGDMQNNANFSIYKSTNSGATFTALDSTSKNWLGLKASSDGTKLIGWDRSNNVWISQDSGVNWEFQNNHPSSGIQSVKFSGDGSKAYMTTGNQYGSSPVAKVFRYTLPVTSPSITLSSSSETATVETAMSGYSINSTGGRAEQYSISPALSAGLFFSTSTGLITGTPTEAAATTSYTITATNAAGSATATFTLRVRDLTKGSFCLPGNVGVTGGTVNSYFTVTLLSPIDTALSVNDFTIATWIKTPGNYSGGNALFSIGNPWPYATNGGFAVKIDGNMPGSNSTLGVLGKSDSSSGVLPAANTWFHVALSRVSGQSTVYLNGVAKATYADANHWTSTSFKIGSAYPGVVNGFPGCYSGLVVANSALFTSDFSSNLPYPSTMTVPSGGQVLINPSFLDPIASWNKVSGGPVASSTGSISLSDDIPVRPLLNVTPTFTKSSANLLLGERETFTATVTAGATGTVVFKDGSGNTLCTTGTLDGSGLATCSWLPSAVGTYVVTAYYSGDSGYAATTSATQSVSVTSVITYNTNGAVGTTPTAATFSGSAITLPLGTGLGKSGYNFGGWSLTETGTAVTSPYSPSGSRTLYAVWTARQYTITYNANGGTGSQSAGSYTTAAAATTLPTSTTFLRTGYSFGGWGTSAGSTTPVTNYSTSADSTFYVIWTRGSFNVRFLANGGLGTMDTQTSSASANLTANTFTFADRTFTGWNTYADGTGTAYTNSQSYPFLANLTLYARWGNVITFSSQGATSGSPSRTSQSWTSGSINLPTIGTMVKAGYTFSGWTTGSQTYAGGASYTPTAGITFNPVWTAITYTISYNSNQATGGSVPSSQSWTTGTTALTLSGNSGTLAKTGYTFGGWAASVGSTTAVTTYSTSANKVFYAIWTPVNYVFTYALNGGTSTLPTQASLRIYNSLTLAATPTRANYNFAGWSTGSTTYGALATFSIGASTPTTTTFTAQWTPVYTLAYVLNGSPSVVTGGGLYDSGTVVSLAAAPSFTGYNFGGWLDTAGTSRSAGSNFTIVENSTLQARWTAISYSITYNLGGGSGTLPLQSSLTIGQTFQVAPTVSRAGYTFDGWNDGSDTYTAGSTYVIGSSNVTLTARWSAVPYTVTFDLGGGEGTLPIQADGSIGSTFSLPASGSNPSLLAHTFTGWSDGSALYQAGSTYTFGASDVTLTAQFSLNGYTKITYSLGTGVGIAPIQASVLEGTTITIANGAQVTRANYAFAGWNDGTSDYAAGDRYVVGPESAPITFTPNWTSGYNVTYSTGSGFGAAPVDIVGRITGSTFAVASDATINRQGFTFTGWSDGTNVYASGATYTVASSNITLTAQWVQNSLAGIASSALTPLASFSIVNGVGPTGSFNFGSSSVSYEVPVNALSAGTVISIYGLTDFSSLTGVIPSGKTVISSTVIAWIGTDGTVADTNSPIKMTITDSQIVPGSVVYAVTGNTLQLLGTATTKGSIVTSISSDPVLVIANPVVTNIPTPPSNSNIVSSSVDNSAAIAAANAKLEADKAAAELKAARDKKAAEDAEAAALTAAKELADAQAQAAATLKAAEDKAAEELRIAEELRLANLKAEEDLKTAAAKKAADDIAAAARAVKPAVTLYSVSPKLKLSAYDNAYLETYVKSLKNGAAVSCIGYTYTKNTTLKKATVLAKSQASAVCTQMKRINKTLKTSIVVYPSTKAPKAATGAKWVGVSYRIDGFKTAVTK